MVTRPYPFSFALGFKHVGNYWISQTDLFSTTCSPHMILGNFRYVLFNLGVRMTYYSGLWAFFSIYKLSV